MQLDLHDIAVLISMIEQIIEDAVKVTPSEEKYTTMLLKKLRYIKANGLALKPPPYLSPVDRMLRAIARSQTETPPSKPEVAPELWPTIAQQQNETVVAFIDRVYGNYLGHGLTRADIRRLDPPLYQALNSWLRKKASYLPFELPTLQEETDARLLWKKESPADLEKRARELEREASAIRRRLKKAREIVWVNRRCTDGRNAYFFFQIETYRKAQFLAAVKSGDMPYLEKVGKVAAAGYGEEPSDEVKALLRDKYGYHLP